MYTVLYITRSADQIGDRVYKLVYMVFENNHECWEFTYVDYSRWHAVMSLGHVNIEKCEPEQALRQEKIYLSLITQNYLSAS